MVRNLKCEFAKLFFLNEQIGWAMSNAGAAGSGFVLTKTQNGGNTWDSTVVLPGGDLREGSIYFMDENHGSVLTGGKFFPSNDGGKTWTGATGQAGGKPRMEFADAKVGLGHSLSEHELHWGWRPALDHSGYQFSRLGARIQSGSTG